MDTPIKTVFTFTRDEYLRALRRHYKSVLHPVRDVIVGLAMLVAGLLLYSAYGGLFYLLVPTILGAILLIIVVYALLILPVLIYRSDPRLKWEYSLTFFDDRIEFKTNEVDSTLGWPLYHSWRRDDEFYILYYGKRDLSVIPRRAFESDESDRQFTALVERKIGRAAK
jgi:hypothetical protein